MSDRYPEVQLQATKYLGCSRSNQGGSHMPASRRGFPRSGKPRVGKSGPYLSIYLTYRLTYPPGTWYLSATLTYLNLKASCQSG